MPNTFEVTPAQQAWLDDAGRYQEFEAIWEQVDAEPDWSTQVPPEPYGSVAMLVSTPCSLCEQALGRGDIALFTDEDDAGFSHARCIAAEMAEAADPYRFFGVRQSDF